MIILMFIGASPGSTGGGVKVSTFGVTVAAFWATARGDSEPRIFEPAPAAEQIAAAPSSICLIAFLAVNGVAAVLLVTEARDLLPTLFEVVSAFGTVGLSMGESGAPLSLVGVLLADRQNPDHACMMFGPHRPADAGASRVARRACVRSRSFVILKGRC